MDRIHIFRISPSNGHLQPQAPLLLKSGSGPRHAVFWTPKTKAASLDDTMLYLVSELDNMMSAFEIRYNQHGLGFTKVFEQSTYGGKAVPDGSKVSGVQITVCSPSV
jgi:6-phosphogluconolactonase (cycloisomerase 2 family)